MRTWKTWDELLVELEKKEKLARIAGGADKQKAQKEKNKLLCRERFDYWKIKPPSRSSGKNTETYPFDRTFSKIRGQSARPQGF